MTKFKVGDEVYYGDGYAKRFAKITRLGTFAGENIVYGVWHYKGKKPECREDTWMAADRVTLVSPPTTFEVGKKYKYKDPGDKRTYIATIEYISVVQNKAIGYWNDELQSIAALPLDKFEKYVEIKPEDWRCLHYVNNIASLGGESFSSKEEVEKKFSSSPNFIKAVRVDA